MERFIKKVLPIAGGVVLLSGLAPIQAVVPKADVTLDGGAGGSSDASTVSYVTDGQLTGDGAWSWFTEPRAVRAGDFTYVGWVTKYPGDIVVGQYDHQNNVVRTATLHAAFQPDDHDDPSILVLPDRRLQVFYSQHAGRNLFTRETLMPDSIEYWSSERSISIGRESGYTYPSPFHLADEGKTYLFWRGANFLPYFSTSDDSGATWLSRKNLITTVARNPYVRYTSNNRDSFSFAFTDSHPELVTVNNIYFAKYRNGNFYHADGSLIKSAENLPLRVNEVDLVYDSEANGRKAWIWDVALDRAGAPVVVFASFVSTTDHRYHYARWTGTNWEENEIVAAGGSIDTTGNDPYYSGGIILDHDNPSVVYLSRQVNGQFEIERWVTPDGGTTWLSQAMTSESMVKNVRPVVPYGHRFGDCSAVWMNGSYTGYTNYSTALQCSHGNQPPLVSAGLPVSVNFTENAVTVRGFVYDDGVPAPIRTIWVMVDGPAPAGIQNPLSLETIVTLPVPGVYVLRLYAFDGSMVVSNDVTLIRLSAGASSEK